MSVCFTDGRGKSGKKNQSRTGHANPDVLLECMFGKQNIKNMKKQKLQLAILAGAMCLAVQSKAAVYDLTYTGGSSAARACP